MKSGFAVIIGRSNVGKSTLLNALAGRKLSIITPVPQTTRHVIHGTHEDSRGQIIFMDTPGVLKGSHGNLTGVLLKKVEESLKDVDVIVYVVDPTRSIGSEERFMLSLLRRVPEIPKLLALNKYDLRTRPYRDSYIEFAPELFQHIIEISAATGEHIPTLLDAVYELLPEGEPMYGDVKTNITKEQWVAELIREKAIHVSRDELPYEMHVIVDSIVEKPTRDGGDIMFVISARIVVSADRYKKMIIGSGGRTIKEIGSVARKEFEQLLDKKVFLELEVETNPHWMAQI